MKINRTGKACNLARIAGDNVGLIGEGDPVEQPHRYLEFSSWPEAEEWPLTRDTVLVDAPRSVAAIVIFAACTRFGLGNLHRWQRNGAWGPVYDEWPTLLENTNDGELFAAMLGRDEHSDRLRQSPPYVGLLPCEVVRRLNEEATG